MTDEDISELIESVTLVTLFFKDRKKVQLWFDTSNPLLGGLRPIDLVSIRRPGKLLKFVKTMLAENKESE